MIMQNEVINSIDVSALSQVDNLVIRENAALETFEIPAAVVEVGYNLFVQDNEKLEYFEVPGLSTITMDLAISNNGSLSDFDLGSLQTVGENFSVTNNAALPQCFVDDLLGQLLAPPGQVTMSGNDVQTGCN